MNIICNLIGHKYNYNKDITSFPSKCRRCGHYLWDFQRAQSKEDKEKVKKQLEEDFILYGTSICEHLDNDKIRRINPMSVEIKANKLNNQEPLGESPLARFNKGKFKYVRPRIKK